MKKILFLLLCTVQIYGQTSTGQEQEFDYGIKNNSTQTITTPTYIGTFGTDGTQGKIPSALIEKTDNKQNSLAVDGTGVKYPTVDAVNAGFLLKQNSLNWKKPQDYGGVGDGVTDASTAIQNAINASSTTYIPVGTYIIDNTLLIPSNHTIIFEDGAKFKSKTGLNEWMITNSDHVAGNTNINIIGGEFDGNKAGQTSFLAALYFDNVDNSSFDNLYIHDANGHPVVDDYNGALTFANSSFVSVNNSKSENNNGTAFIIMSSDHINVKGGFYSNNGCTGVGWYDSPYCSAIGVTAENNTTASGISANGFYSTVVGNNLSGNKYNINVGHTTPTNQYASYSTITGNTSVNGDYGINLQPGQVGVILSGNNVYGNGTDYVADPSTLDLNYYHKGISIKNQSPSPNAAINIGVNFNTVPSNTHMIMQGGSALRFTGEDGNADQGGYIFGGNNFLALGSRTGGINSDGLSITDGIAKVKRLLVEDADYTTIKYSSTTSNANGRNWSISTNSQAYGDFEIRQSSVVGGGTDYNQGTQRLHISSIGDLTINGNIVNASLTGTPTAPTAAPGTNTTQIATTAFVAAGLATKQNTLTNPITGTGTTNYIPKFTASGVIGNSLITDNGSLVSVNSLSEFKGTTASDGGQLGSELTTTATGINWTGTGFATGYTHTTGDVTPLVSTLAAVANNLYQITYTVTGRTTGSITINFGGIAIGGITASGNSGPKAISTATLNIVPTTDFNGTVVLSIKAISASVATTTFKNSSGAIANEIRAHSNNTNLSIGVGAGKSNTTGVSNSSVGRDALANNTTGNYNSAVGRSALLNNTTGSGNNAVGTSALQNNTTGSNNSAVGTSALENNTTGSANNAVGQLALLNNTTGSNNSAIGESAGRYIANKSTQATILNNSIMLGYRTSPLADNQTNQVVIGYDAIGLGSNTTVIGNSSTTTARMFGRQLVNTSTDNGTDQLQVNGTTKTTALTVSTAPTTSTGTYDILTRNTSTGVVEKVASSSALLWTDTAGTIRNNNSGEVELKPSTKVSILNAANAETARITNDGNFITKTTGTGFFGTDDASGMYFDNARLNFRCYGDSEFKFNPIHLSWTDGRTQDVVGFSKSTINPTSGTAIFNMLNISPTVNQTGGANGITRALYISPTLTSAADFRAIEVTGGNSIFQKVIAQNTIRLKNYTVATLPTGTQGDTAYVTDALAPTYLVTVVGGGAVVCPVFYNGTSWVSH